MYPLSGRPTRKHAPALDAHGWLVDSRLSDLWLARFDNGAGLQPVQVTNPTPTSRWMGRDADPVGFVNVVRLALGKRFCTVGDSLVGSCWDDHDLCVAFFGLASLSASKL